MHACMLAHTKVTHPMQVLDEAEQDIEDAVTCLTFYAALAEDLDQQQHAPVDVGSRDFIVEVISRHLPGI